MNWIYHVRKFFFSQTMKNINHSKHRLIPWNEVKSVSILLPHYHLKQQKQVQETIDFFAKKAIKVNILAFAQVDKQPLELPNFSSKEISWNFVPNSAAVNNFANQQTDVLFAFYAHENLTMDYIVAKSKAECKVGYFEESKTKYFDLMLMPNFDSTQSILQLIEKSIEYLQKIENKP